MSDVTERFAHLSPAKRLLLQKMRREQGEGAEQGIRRRAADGPVPLSFAQQRLWFIHQMDPASPAYHLPYPLRLRGALDVPALERSLGALVERHETLRTVFPERGGEPVQEILPPAPRRIPVADLRGLAEPEREAAARRLVADETRRPFDLAAGPLLRVLLVRTGEEEWVLSFTLHHVVSDGWSTGILTREITELYRACSRGEAPRLPELPIQYADYAAWQRERLSGEAFAAQTDYWRGQLAGAPPLLELPTDFPRRAAESAPGATHLLHLPQEVARGVRELAQREGATVFMALLAAWQLLLSRWSGQDDVSVGTAIAGRTRRETEGLIGFFVNTLVVRTDMSGEPSFRELLGRVRETTLGAYQHQDLPFERLVEELAPERSLTHTPLFQVMFALRNLDRGELRLGELALEPFPAGEAPALFDLNLDLTEGPDGIVAALTYRTDLFEAGTIERMAEHFRLLLEGAVAHPDRPVSELRLIGPEEEHRLLAGWNAPRAYSTDRLVPHLFAEQAARTPEAPAALGPGGALSYAELDRRADRLARVLRALGVAPEVPVGVCLERGPGLLVAVLGIWKAGGAYVPLDPAYPPERLAYLLQDSAVPVLLTREHLRDALPPHGARVLLLDDADPMAEESAPAPGVEIAPETLAYVIYTSGSTGRPKGVRVTHGSLLHTLRAALDAFAFRAGDVVPSLASFAFDIWLFESVLPLLAGGSVHVLPREEVLETEQLTETLASCTALHAVPALMRQIALVLRASGRTLPAMRQVFVGGDAVAPDLLEEMREVFSAAAIRVLYGPTEGTIICAAHPVGSSPARRQWVGRPLGNASLYVLDRALQPVPVGVPGELCIGGAAVARDYLGRPELTAEKFQPDPFAEGTGGRMYRTGDRVRWTAEGELEFLGRVDTQVKIRGFRIEPGEVESVLLEHGEVREAVVVVREDAPGERRLVGYVVPGEGAAPDAEELRRRLARRLPDYMVPAALVVLDALPLTPNGKVDRRALPAPAGASGPEYLAPRTPVEETLAGIFAEVLKADRVGVRDDFFARGGHSLLAMRVIARVRDALGVELPVRDVFEQRTVEALAARITPATPVEDAPAAGESPAPERLSAERRLLLRKWRMERTASKRIPRRAGDGPAPLSFAQQRLWFIDQLEPGNPTYNIPAPLRLHGPLEVRVLRRALAEIVRRHEALRTVFEVRDGEPVQVVRPAGLLPLPVVDLSSLPAERREAEARRLAGEDALGPFDLARGPLLRATLLRLGLGDHAALFTLHHVVSDGWSMDVLVREMSALYRAYVRGEGSPLPELEIQYADYAVWQRAHLAGPVLDEQLRYWKERLAGAPPLLEIPTDRPRPPVAGGEGGRRGTALPPGAAHALREVAAREGTTLFMTLLAAWQLLLSRWSGQEDVSVGTPTAGRTRTELEPLIGFFVNTLVLRADLSGEPTFREVLGRVREATLGAYQHQDLPFERLVEELAPERSLTHTPLFQVMFSFEASSAGGRSSLLEGVRLAPLAHGGDVAKFDLSLVVEDRGDQIRSTLVYRAEIFDAATVERMLRHFRTLAERLAADPGLPVSEVDLLTPAERAHLLEGGGTRRAHPRTTVHALFAEQAHRTPDAPALVFAGETLTYAELDARSARLARLLRQRGVGPEVTVGICLPRTPDMVVSLLAVLRAGGAYVPLDPAYPAERLGYMIEDSAARLVVTESALAERLPPGVETLALDRIADELQALPAEAPETGVQPENLSHVIFTSGSTGRPKGVMIRHSSTVVLLHWLRENVSDEERSGVLLSTSINFDVSIAELFGTLCWGGTLYLVENALELASFPHRERIRYASMVPTAAAELLRMGGIPAGVRTLNLGGEALPNDLAQALYTLGTVQKVGNLYGPTEDTTYSTYSLVERGGAQVYVGRPVTNTRAYVLDGSLRPVPVGVIGELYLTGDGLARGYAKRPDLTAERFLPDPYGEAGSRMYRVMDRVRWRADGVLEYFGRTDFQVKVRGFRIELGEIETALRAHPAVRDAVVVVREDAPGERRLVGYVAAQEEMPAPPAEELRALLRGRLPEYMVPGAFVALPELPLTPNGKVDRRALPAPERTSDGAEQAPPRTPVERTLAEIFARVLHREQVGIHDSFFDLGGHSLLATRVTSQAREALGVEVPLRAVFEAPTVAALAERVEATLRTEEETDTGEGEDVEATSHEDGVGAGERAAKGRLSAEQRLLLRKWRLEKAGSQKIPRRAGNGPAPLSFAQQRLWFIHQLDPHSSAYNMPFALRLRGALDVPALQRSLTELVRRHEAVRTALVDRGGGEAMQVILPAAPVPFPAVDLTRLPEEQRRAEALCRVREEGQRPFDLTRGPLLRALLVRLGDEEWAICFTMHHIVSDGWSMGVLTREISALYGAYSRGESSPLPELAVQYADFAAWQREWLSGETLEAQLAYWRERLAGAPPLLELPTDHPRRSALGVSETGSPFLLSPEASQALRELARREGATLFMALLAGWQTLLGRYAAQEDVVVGTPIANRTRAELEPLIGFFVNTLVLRGDLSGDPSFRELLGRVRESTLGAYQHQDLPFERLVEELAPERSLMHNPLFQVMFALQNMEQRGLSLGDVEMEAIGGADTGAKFDIGVTLYERADRVMGHISYRTDLFEVGTIERMAEHFRLLLEGAVAHPDRPVSELRLIGPDEEHRLLAGWNAPRAYPTDRLVPHLFAEQAARTPEAPAALGPGGALSYTELERRADRLARVLRALGVAPEVPVGVCLERGPDLLVAVLGIWKAGGAYVPLDPAYPPERLAYLLQDSAVPVLLTREHLRDALPPHGARVLLLDDADPMAEESAPAPEVEIAPQTLAYVIYTSGSTGRPKGVRVTHGSLLHTLRAALDAFAFRAGDVVPSLASFAFDIWLFESVLPLLAGGSVHVLPREEVLETEQLTETLASCTALHAVPALMRQIALVLRASGRTLPAMRQVFVGGDAVPPDLLEEMREVFPAATVRVLYGPTEDTIICAAHEVGSSRARRQWVGRPLGNASLYVLDRALQPVPVGVPGELCIGGAAVARDYLGRPELTAEKFPPDPFAEGTGGRMYRTGDRVRWTTEGELEFLGRVDTQVKIRGFRIEPGEIESVLLEHGTVREAAVVVREDTPGDRRLVGYVVPAEEAADGEARSEFQEEHVEQWEALFGDTYGSRAADEDPAFNVVGWNSSYTGEPIPAGEMREWVEDAAGRIRTLRPRRVLEIGCGTGLLLFRIAPECREYWGTDFAATAISYLERQLARRPIPGVRLQERAADDFDGIPAGHFDLVVINSVAQYFPGVDYLLRVLDGAVASLAPGGTLFLGDLRSYPLLEAFHASVELVQAPSDLPASALRDRIRRRVVREKELLVDPELFRALPRRLPRISAVEVRLKDGRSANEMTRFRYDVLLHVEAEVPATAPEWRRWDEGMSLEAVARELDDSAPEVLGIARVPNARVAGALAVLDALRSEDDAGSVEALRGVAAGREAESVDPEAFRELAEARGYRVRARWAARGTPGEYDVLLVRDGSDAVLVEDGATPLAWSAYANNPLARKRSHWLVPELRGWLRERLPDYMVPGALVVLDALPLTPNGKIDRRALPAPEAAAQDEAYLAPRTTAEEILAGIWAEVLQVERVGVEDDFFALGGHSLLATRVVSRAREAFGVEVPLRTLFEAPTVARLAARVEDLLLQGAGMQLPPLLPTPRDGSPLPLSFAQQRLWFIHQLEPLSPAYNMPSPLRLRGRLDVGVMERALTELVRRHESLRTVFHSVEGEPVQVIRPAEPAIIPVVDLRGLPGELRERAVLRLAREEMARPFDLARGPLLRATLIRPGEEEWALLFTLHHIVSDGWSMGVLTREISILYEAYLAGRPSPLPEPQLRYADFAVWQRGWLAGEVLEAQLDYWREHLAGAPPLLEIPTDRPRPLVASDRAEQRAFTLSPEASQALRALSHREGATLFMTLLAVYQALLSRWSGQDDVVVGTPVAGRGRLELEGLIGFFVNMLVVRTRLEGPPTFRELVRRVREGVLGAQAHQDLPFERLVDELHVERSLDRAPIFQAIFALLAAGRTDERLSLGGVQVYPLHSGETTAKFDLSLTVQDGGERLVGGLVYRADLFGGATMERMLQHFRLLADRLAADPDLPVSDADLLTAAERAHLLEGGGTRRVHPRTTVHALFAEQAARTPDAAALVFAGEALTYAELDARSARLALLLRRRGVGPEVTVGICLPRTPEMVVSLLAVLRAGSAYVPLDPAYPVERLGYMIEDSGARLVVTESALADRLPPGVETLALDRIADELMDFPAEAPETGVQPENLSHVIFTSGSTGRPKGVMIRHSGTVVLLHWLREHVSDEERSGVLFSTSINFDVSIAELFGTLCWGGTLYLVENALELASFPDREWIRYASMVPTAAAELLRMGGIPAGVRTLNLGGEALPNDLAQALYALGTVQKVGNLYGPTEDTTYSTYSLVERGGAQVYVGRPVTNTRAYVLDGSLRPVPVGVIGELYLAGDGLARGYAKRPELTAERFLPDPYGEAGSRMYRVMDRVRWRADGELEYFGRTDFQVKVRGFRIELGEIETALRAHPAVRDAVVVVREDAPGDRRLVAYVVAAEGAEVPGAGELRAWLRQRVPEYMVPGAFVALPELPLTPNGKVDRRALPAPERVGDESAEYLAPRDTVELELAGVWEEVLGASPVGVRDNFFALGGHSLLAVRLMARIETVLGARLPLATLFAAPTIESLAAVLRREAAGPDPSPLVPVRASGARPPLFFVHPVGGDVLCYAPLSHHLGPDQPFYALRARGLTGEEEPHATIESMASDYVEVLRAAQPEGPYRLGGWSMGGVVAFEMARRLEAAGERVELLALVDSMVPSLAGRTLPNDEAVRVRTFAADLGLRLDDALLEAGGAPADAREYVRRVLEAAREAGIVPPDLGFDQVWRLYEVFRVNLEAMYRYRPGVYGGRVTLLRAAEHDPSEGEALGWESVAAGGVEARVVPGSHFTLVREPHAAELARALAESLESQRHGT